MSGRSWLGMGSEVTQLLLAEIEEAVRVVEAIEDQQYLYVAIVDDATCETCLDYEQNVFSQEEIDSEFPDWFKADGVIHPNVHMTLWGKATCRCSLFAYYGGVGDGDGDGDKVRRLSDDEYDFELRALVLLGILPEDEYQRIKKRKASK